MFETSVIQPRAISVHRYRFLTLSIAMHSCVIAAVITATVASTRLPTEAPRQMEIPVFMPAVSLPPALGSPDARPVKPKPVASATAPRTAVAPTAPAVIPDQPNSTAGVEPAALSAAGSGDGEAAGVPYGTPGGIGTDTAGIGSPAGTGIPLPVGGEVKAPVVIQRVLPEYPRVAVLGRINGWVVLECIIDKSGHIRDARVVKSSFAAFDQPALDAVRRWVFSPGTLRGETVDTIFDLTVSFQVK